MAIEIHSLDSPHEKRDFGHGELALVNVAGLTFGRSVFHPGWKWSDDVRPIVKTESCQLNHTGYVITGHLHVEMDDGSTADVYAGDAVRIPAGHDAWVVGDEDCVILDVSEEADTYAKPAD